MVKRTDKYTADDFYQAAKDNYKLAIEYEDNNVPQNKIDACWGAAVQEFWCTLALGSEKAPLALFKSFWQGLGVKKDDDITALMYGTALKFTPEDCAKLPTDSKPVIPKSMQPRIDVLVTLIKQTHAEIPAEGISMDGVLNQMTKFNNTIKLPSGKLIQSCFTEKITQTNSKKKDLKSKALELTKNLVNHNKSTIATTNRMSKKATGCSIS